MFTTSATQETGQAKVKILAFVTAHMAVPDRRPAEVACGDYSLRYTNERNRRGWLIFDQFILDHLAE
jgi:hypothetical protein